MTMQQRFPSSIFRTRRATGGGTGVGTLPPSLFDPTPVPPDFEFPFNPQRPTPGFGNGIGFLSEDGNGDEGGTGGSVFDDLIGSLFDEEPNIAFQTQLNQTSGLSPNQRQFFEGSFDRIFNRFLGAFGGQAQESGEVPDFRFQDFIQDFNFEEDFLSRAPSQRPGGSTARFRPPTQFRL